MFVNFNGKLIPADQAIFGVENRAFRYGDGLFESIRMFNGQIPFWKKHWKRLEKGANYLDFNQLQDADFYKKEISKLCGSKGNWRIRLSVFRKDGGLYTPVDSETNFLIEAQILESNQFELNKEGLRIAICDTISIPRHPLSNLKTCNSLPYVMASIFKKEKQVDDCILINSKGQIAEGSSSNIFILENKQLLTPPLGTGCKDGTMRKVIIKLAKSLDLEVIKTHLIPKDLKKADEIWLTNATQGLRWVANFEGKKFGNDISKTMIAALNKEIMRIRN